jgi:hypothetical protein
MVARHSTAEHPNERDATSQIMIGPTARTDNQI